MSVYIPKGRKNYTVEFEIDGVRFRKGTRSPSERAARRLEARWRVEFAEELANPKPKKEAMSLNTAFARYYREVATHQVTADDTFAKLGQLMDLLCQVPGITKHSQLSEIDDDVIAQAVALRRGETALRKETLVSNATVNRGVTELLRRVWRRAGKVWRVNLGAEPDWSLHLLPESDARGRELSEQECRDLFKHLRPDYHGLVLFGLLTGMRLGNIRALTWKQVDMDRGEVAIKVKSRSHDGGRNVTVPMTPPIRALLASEKGRHPIYVFTYECKRNRGHKRPELRRRKGERYPFSKNGWRKDWWAALEAAKIEDLRFHDTRHDAARKVLRASGNLKVVQRMLGHADISSTNRYADVLLEDVRAGMESAHSPHHIPTGLIGPKAKELKSNAD